MDLHCHDVLFPITSCFPVQIFPFQSFKIQEVELVSLVQSSETCAMLVSLCFCLLCHLWTQQHFKDITDSNFFIPRDLFLHLSFLVECNWRFSCPVFLHVLLVHQKLFPSLVSFLLSFFHCFAPPFPCSIVCVCQQGANVPVTFQFQKIRFYFCLCHISVVSFCSVRDMSPIDGAPCWRGVSSLCNYVSAKWSQ